MKVDISNDHAVITMTDTELETNFLGWRPRESHEARARRLFDEMARNIGREAVNHLKAMYPAALKSVAGSAETSLTNHIRNDINWRMRPLLMAMIAMHREWDSEAELAHPESHGDENVR